MVGMGWKRSDRLASRRRWKGRIVTGIGRDGHGPAPCLRHRARSALARMDRAARTIFATDIQAETIASRAASKKSDRLPDYGPEQEAKIRMALCRRRPRVHECHSHAFEILDVTGHQRHMSGEGCGCNISVIDRFGMGHMPLGGLDGCRLVQRQDTP